MKQSRGGWLRTVRGWCGSAGPWLMLALATVVIVKARISQVPGELRVLLRVWERGGEVPSGQHRQLELGRLFHASGAMTAAATGDLVWWLPFLETEASDQAGVRRAVRADIPEMFRDANRRSEGASEDWLTGLLAGAAAPMRVHVGGDPSWLDADWVYVERAALDQVARQLARDGRIFDWQVSCNRLHLLGRGARPQPPPGVAAEWQRTGGHSPAAKWLLDVAEVKWPPPDDGKWSGVLTGGLLAAGVFGGMAVLGALAFRRRRELCFHGAGSPGQAVAALALGWCACVLLLTLVGAGQGGGQGSQKLVMQVLLIAIAVVGGFGLLLHRRCHKRPSGRGGLEDEVRQGAGDPFKRAGQQGSRAGLWVGWGLVALAVLWVAVRSLVQIPFDAPGLVTHGYKVLLFDRLGAADPWALLEPGRQFARPHYPHGFSVSAWLAMPSAGWRLGEVAQWQVVLPFAMATVLLARVAFLLSGGHWGVLLLVALWAGSWPIQRLAGTWYAEPLMLLFWCGALVCWSRLLDQGAEQDREGLSGPDGGTQRGGGTLGPGGCALRR